MKGHKKHSDITKPAQGKFHRDEWSIIGAPCSRILEIATALNEKLKDKFKLAYLDDDHNAEDAEDLTFAGAIQNRIKHYSFLFTQPPSSFAYRQMLNAYDGVLLNGNHYTANKQIVLINQKKKESLSKKLDRLSNVAMIILDKGETSVYDFLKSHLPQDGIPIFSIDDINGIANALTDHLEQKIAPLAGLVLAGGKSMRMGQDKTSLIYHGKDQLTYTAELLGKFCNPVFISQAQASPSSLENYQIIPDSFIGLGPFGGLASAFRHNPNQAYLSLPCDVPLVDEAMLHELIDQRNPSRLATCFHNPATDFPEPLITIWEPRAYPVLLQYLAQGYSCPRKVLINTDIEMIQAKHPEKMVNANTPEERQAILNKLN